MSKPEDIKMAPNASVMFGKPTHPLSAEVIHRIGMRLARDEATVEAHLPQYFILGSTPAPRLLLVLVGSDVSQQEGVALRARSILAKLGLAHLVADVWIMADNDRLLPAVRHARCQIDLL